MTSLNSLPSIRFEEPPQKPDSQHPEKRKAEKSPETFHTVADKLCYHSMDLPLLWANKGTVNQANCDYQVLH